MILSRRLMISAGLIACGMPVAAASRRYDLWSQSSSVSFIFTVNGAQQTGTVPVSSADIRVDTGDLENSSADVTADIRAAKTGMLFVTQALLSPSVLDAANHPAVRFRSTGIVLGAQGRISEGASIEGQLTLRGVTRPLDLDAVLSRPAGSAPDDLSVLTIRLTGRLSRSAFGATGYPQMVADEVELDIRAEIRARA